MISHLFICSFRYSVKVTEDHLASIQLSTSKSDVYLELKVFENDTMVCVSWHLFIYPQLYRSFFIESNLYLVVKTI